MSLDLANIVDTAETATTAVSPAVGGSELLGVGFSMLVVVAAILLIGWFYSRSRFLGGGASDVINVIAIRALGPKERLMIVEVVDQQLLVGMTSTGVQTLHVFDKPIVVNETTKEVSGFAGQLATAIQEMRK